MHGNVGIGCGRVDGEGWLDGLQRTRLYGAGKWETGRGARFCGLLGDSDEGGVWQSLSARRVNWHFLTWRTPNPYNPYVRACMMVAGGGGPEQPAGDRHCGHARARGRVGAARVPARVDTATGGPRTCAC